MFFHHRHGLHPPQSVPLGWWSLHGTRGRSCCSSSKSGAAESTAPGAARVTGWFITIFDRKTWKNLWIYWESWTYGIIIDSHIPESHWIIQKHGKTHGKTCTFDVPPQWCECCFITPMKYRYIYLPKNSATKKSQPERCYIWLVVCSTPLKNRSLSIGVAIPNWMEE